MHRALRGRERGGGIAQRADVDDDRGRRPLLEQRKEHLLRDLVADAGVLRIADDADDLERRRGARIEAEADVAADRAPVAEEALRIALVDDRVAVAVAPSVVDVRVGRLRRRAFVARLELAANEHRNPHRPEVARADRVAVRVHLLARLGLIAFDGHRAVPLVALEQTDVRERHRLDAGLRRQPLDERFVQGGNPLRRVAADRRRDVEGDQALRLDAEIDQPQILERADEEPGADEQQHRDRHLRHDERLAHADAAARHRADLILQRGREVRLRRTQRGRETEEKPGRERQREVECEHAVIDRAGDHMRRLGRWQEPEQELRRPRRDREPEPAADRGEQDALDEQLADDAAAARAEREAHGDLPLPRRRACDEQARDVRARDQQHADDDPEEQPQRLRQLLADRRAALRGRQQRHLPFQELLARVRRRVAERGFLHFLLEQAMEERLQRGERLLERDAGFQAAEDVHPPAAPVVHVVPVRRHLRLHHHRHADARHVADVDAVESGLRDADDRELRVVHRDRLADHVRIAAEAIAPVRVAEHRDRAVAALAIVVGADDAPDGRADAEHLEERARHELARHALGLALDADVHGEAPAGEEAGEDLRRRRRVRHRPARARQPRGRVDEAVPEVFVHRERQHVAARIAAVVVARAAEQHELLGLSHGDRAQQHFVDQREDGGVRADAQGDRQQRDRREKRGAAEAADGVSQIARKVLHRACALDGVGRPTVDAPRPRRAKERA